MTGDTRAQSKSGASSPVHFLRGGGEMGERIRGHDWAATSLGAPTQWPQSLKTAIRIMLTSRQPIWIGWGKDLLYFYNDPYKSIIGGKHPWALGRPTATVWQEIWGEIGPMLDTAMRGDEGTYVEQQLLIMERNGYPEETYYTFSYSPIPGDDGGAAAGIICANTDDTQSVISERQLALLRDLAGAAAATRSWQEVCERSVQALATDPRDLPFSAIYIAEPDSDRLTLTGLAGLPQDHPGVPPSIEPGTSQPWPIAEVLRKSDMLIVTGLAQRFAQPFPVGVWQTPPDTAALVPITATGDTGRSGVLVVGLNPFRLLDHGYSSFLALVAGQIAAGIGNAQAYEEERKRAEALAEIDRAKTAFFSNVSHEFRTPLTLMMGPLEDLLARSQADLTVSSRGMVELAHRNATRLLKLVNTLLDFSRIEAGRTQASYAPIDLAALTSELASNFRSATDRAGLRLRVDCARLAEPVYVDRDMWEKIVLNLLSNAFKFTFEGEIAVELKAVPRDRTVSLSVRDSGIGISAEELPALFERFRRVEGARGRSYEGSGIGLALVQELVQLHGGDIAVESTVGKGTTFTVALPLGRDHLPAKRIVSDRAAPARTEAAAAYVEEALGWLAGDNLSAAETPPTPSSDALGSIAPIPGAGDSLVLVADDNADMRHYIQRLLRSAGFRVVSAGDGEAALALARESRPDLVLTDVMMPRLDGFGLLGAVREDAGLRETPVLLLSARAGEEARLEGIASGADDYLTKPFSARELIARVEVNLRLARIRREGARALQEEARILESLNKVGAAIAAEIDLERAVQVVTDAATELSGAAFGAFFYNVISDKGKSYTLYTLAGVPREAFASFPMPRNTDVFGPTFRGEGIVRSADITKDPRYGRNAPYHGKPKGHLPVCSYLAAPVVAHDGEVLGGLFFGHPEAGVFDERAERLVAGIATQAAIAMDKARLYRSAQEEIERRRHTETALRESERGLEAKVEERTAELQTANERLRAEARERARAEEALRQSQKMESIGQLTGGVAHDFNNLLTIILGNLESLQRHMRDPKPDAARLDRSVDHAMRGARRAASLTQRLLAFSRQQPLDPKPIDINRLVAGMSDLLLRTIGEQFSVETVQAGGLWLAHVDPNQLEVAMLNLAVNARDAMVDGGKLTIETANAHLDESYATSQAEVVPGQYVVIAVSDNGSGMSQETVARAFEPFFTTKEIGHGTGLGLSQVYGFVKQSGGHVKIYSELGEGTTVKIYLPRLHAAADIAEQEAPAKVPGAGAFETLLVVEDEVDVRAHTTGILRELGYNVVEAADGASGLKALREHPEICLLFTDIGLPGGMNGRQLAEAAQAIRPDLNVLFTTGYARNAIVHDGRLDPGVQLITKPFTYAALGSRLRDILDHSRSERRILVVEDEVLLQMLVASWLEAAGLRPEVAGSGADALNRLRLMSDRIDAAIVDLGLPDRSGDILVGELRLARPGLPIVIASGSSTQTLDRALREDDRIAAIAKPYTAEQLLGALARLGVAVEARGK